MSRGADRGAAAAGEGSTATAGCACLTTWACSCGCTASCCWPMAHDWSHSRPIDLSEEGGLREELQRHGRADDAFHLLGEAPEDAG